MATAILADGATVASAVAAAISAGFAGATSVAAWLTIRGRRPKLEVECQVGRPVDGALHPDPAGEAMSVRVRNVRESDVEVTGLWFEPPQSGRDRLRRRVMHLGSLVPPDSWFVKGAGVIPGTVKAHHTEQYIFHAPVVAGGFTVGGAPRYRPVVEIVGDRTYRGNWIDVETVESDVVPTEA